MSGSIQLRDYQNDSIGAVIEARDKENITRPLISLPTGTGKTIIFASLAEQLGAKTLIIAHRDELLRQAEDKVRMIWPTAKIGIVKAKENDFQDKNVVIASIQTICREKRLKQIAAENFSLCIIDEAHHGCAKTYRESISYLGFMDDNPEKLLLGVTATTRRSDKIGLRNVFQKIVYESSIRTMVKGGFLSDIRGYKSNTGVDLTTVRTRNGDFIERELSILVNTPSRNEKVIQSYLEYAEGRKAIAFTSGIQHAHDLTDVFLSHGIEARALSGKTPDDERKELLQAFSDGKIQVLSNCNILTEGYDESSISCILLARPTKSMTLFTQMVGRGTRKHPGKSDCVVINFTDRSHDICALPTLLGLGFNEMGQGESLLEVEEEIEWRERGSSAINKPIGNLEEYDLLGKSSFRWIQVGNEWRLPIGPGLYGALAPDNGKYKIFLFKRGEHPKPFYPKSLEIGYAMGIIEDHARQVSRSFSRKDSPWRNRPASEKQIDLLKRLGINPANMRKGEACDQIEQFFTKQEARRSQRQYAGMR